MSRETVTISRRNELSHRSAYRWGVMGLALAALMMFLAMTYHAWMAMPGRPANGAMDMAAEAPPAAPGARPVTTIKPLSCEALPDLPGKAVTTAVVNFPPDAYTPRHRHPGSVTAYVLNGTLRSQLAGGPVITYTTGQSWFEPTGAIHMFAENASRTEPASILAFFVTDQDCGPLTIPDHG